MEVDRSQLLIIALFRFSDPARLQMSRQTEVARVRRRVAGELHSCAGFDDGLGLVIEFVIEKSFEFWLK